MSKPARARPSARFSSVVPIATAACEPLESRRLLAATYYVSASGSDGASGTSTGSAWRSIDRVNRADLQSGDRVLFEGGSTFAVKSGSGSNVIGSSSLNDATLSGSGGTRRDTITTNLKPGQGYALHVRHELDNPTSGRASAGVDFFKNGVKVGGVFLKLRNTDYTTQSRDFVAPRDFDRAEAWVKKESGSSVLRVDWVEVRESSTPLTIGAEDAGTSSSPVTIGSYGSGRATIDGRNGIGIELLNAGGVAIRDLNVVGTWDGSAGVGSNNGAGLEFVSTLANNGKYNYIRVDNVTARGFKWAGVQFEGRLGKAGFNDVRLNNVIAHDNGDVGINFVRTSDFTNSAYAYKNVYIGNSRAYDNGGLPNLGLQSGDGILVEDTDGAVVERNVSHHNGAHNRATDAGPGGIYTTNSNNVVIQFNESYSNKGPSGGKDGSGFDLDGGVTNSILQYNYSHDNDGPGLQVAHYSFARPQWSNNVVRYNISQNDARQNNYGAIHIGGEDEMDGLSVYHNTVYLTPGDESSIAAIVIDGGGSDFDIRNNIFYTTGGTRLVDRRDGGAGVDFNGNAYWSDDDAFRIKWGSSTYSSLSAWRSATGEESGGTGVQAAPRLINPGGGGTINDPSKLYTLTAYQLTSLSTLIDRGVSVSPTPSRDFFGTSVPSGARLDIGAAERVGGAEVPEPPPPSGDSPTIGISNGVLTVTGTTAGETVTFTRVGMDDVIVTVGGTSEQYDLDEFSSVSVLGGGGIDMVVVRQSDGAFNATGTSGANTFAVQPSGGDDVSVTVNGTTSPFDIDDEDGLVLSGIGGNDTFKIEEDVLTMWG